MEKCNDCDIPQTIVQMDTTLTKIDTSLHGNGNGAIGMVQRIENVETFHHKYSSSIKFWSSLRGILTKVLVMVLSAGIIGWFAWTIYMMGLYPKP